MLFSVPHFSILVTKGLVTETLVQRASILVLRLGIVVVA